MHTFAKDTSKKIKHNDMNTVTDNTPAQPDGQAPNAFDYAQVPFGYTHCFAAKGCPHATDCLRHLAAQAAPATVVTLHCINPAALPADKEQCPYYRPMRKITLAWGLVHLTDDVPYQQAMSIRSAVRGLWGRTTYYRVRSQERPITPDMQQRIATIFANHGITTVQPRYDRLSEAIDF